MKYWENNQLTDECKKCIESCKELEDLFKYWIEAQKEEAEQKEGVILDTIVEDSIIEPQYFTRDGYIDDKEYMEKKNKEKILFILKEPHITGKKSRDIDEQISWYKEFFESKDILKGNVVKTNDNRPKQKEKIARMAEYMLKNKLNPNYEELKNALKKVAFMNLNKRGGASSCNANVLYKYYKKYYSFIKREIELIKPTTIVLMCGKQINEELSNVIENAKSIKMLHTAVRGKWLNVENKNLDEELKKVNQVEEPHLVFNRTTYKYMIKFIEILEEPKKI